MKSIKWGEISDQDLNLIGLILERVKNNAAEGSALDLVRKDALKMDLAAYHLASPLRLNDLLMAPMPDLLHDVLGIYVTLNRTTGQPRGCFTPRYVFKLTEAQEAEKLGYFLIKRLCLEVKENGWVEIEYGSIHSSDLGSLIKKIIEEKPYLED